jgi:3-oxoacyl-[acyl-carrier protein] reductase
MKLLEGKIAYITGANRGIGRIIALEFGKHGAKVALTHRAEKCREDAEKVAEEIKAMGTDAIAIQADASSMEETQAAIDKVVETWGRIDIVVNNAGITRDTLLLRMNEEQFNEVVNVNLNSCFYSTKAALRTMLRQRSGCFINISSIVGQSGNAGQANYAASKAGIIGFTKSVAKEVASRSIRANAICPGFIATEMTEKIPEDDIKNWLTNIPLNRPGTPEDVANLCVFLGSDMSSYITGQAINVAGGMLM